MHRQAEFLTAEILDRKFAILLNEAFNSIKIIDAAVTHTADAKHIAKAKRRRDLKWFA
jgi:hypothetical protein